MKATGRQIRIRELLESHEFIDLETLCREVGASESSVRRDLIALESEGVLKRVYGGAMAAEARNHLLDFEFQSARQAPEKKCIAALAAGLVEDGQTLILDAGSTVAAVARELIGRSLHVMTTSLAIAEIFTDSRQIELTLTGGYLYPRLRVMVGPLCEQMLSGVSADLLIMGIGGITESGFSNNNTLVVGPERKMIEVSRRVIVVADHTKFGRGAMIHLAPLEVADTVVSDSALPPHYKEMLESRGVKVLIAPCRGATSANTLTPRLG
jgi:DeoR family transcriptional regulator, fructose operon transcriptional repressor